MGKLNISHHKSWHVYNLKNREIVAKDEQEALLKKQIAKDKITKSTQEQRLDILRSKNNPPPPDAQNINLFPEPMLHNPQNQLEKKQQLSKNDPTMYISAPKEIPWYEHQELIHTRSKPAINLKNSTIESRTRKDDKLKKALDPAAKFMTVSSSSKQSNSSSSATSKSIQQLRQERLDRESAERQKSSNLLNPPAKPSKSIHETDSKFYNSQFNPNLTRKHPRESEIKPWHKNQNQRYNPY